MADLPAGTVTFLFTDLEGSTRLLAAHPTAYREAVRRHHDLLRDAVEAHGGVVFETVGDAVYAAFARPTDAVAAALAGQLALRQEAWGEVGPLRARMGVHLGEVEVQGARYFGAPLYRCARLTGTAHGGQVVLSRAACDLVQDGLELGVSLRDLGEHRLKDLQRPERVFQLLHPDLPGDFPPLRSLEARPHNLPLQLTSFVGRERELAAVREALAAHRLVTLTGPAGCGKTRLALQAAAEGLEASPDGAWFVDLAPLADAALVPQTVLAALGARELPGRPPLATLTEHLRARHLLLLLDNCEHLVDACARLVDAVVRGCPGVRVLATSRELLGLAGETAWRVPSLGLPDSDAAPGAAALEASGAGRLFVDRARAVQPGFALTDANAGAVVEVCRRLDGIPLALELAAARVRVLTPEQLAARLDDRFRLLTGGGRTALRRQQTLQATVDWSHDLLTEPERALFRRLAVFPGGATGGFPLEAVEAVGASAPGDPVAPGAVLDLLTGLVDKSLVLADAGGAEERYRLLETLRQYAGERLLQAGESAAVRDRHRDWCLALARAVAAAAAAGDGPRHREASRRLMDERESVRAALAWCASGPAAAPTGLELLADVGQLPGVAGAHMSEHRRWLETLLGLAPARTATRARCLLILDNLLRWHHEFARAGAAAREARGIYEALGDPAGAAVAAVHEGLVAANLGDYNRGVALIAPALAGARARGDLARVEECSRDLGLIAFARGDFATARARLEESRALAERLGLPPHHGVLAAARLATLDRLEGDPRRARERLEATLARVRGDPALDAPGVLAVAVSSSLGDLARAEGRYEEARTLLHAQLRSLLLVGDAVGLAAVAAMAGMLEVARGEPLRGVTILAACAGAGGAGPIGTVYIPEVRVEAPEHLERARAALGEASYAAAWAEGQAMTLEQAVADALEGAAAVADLPTGTVTFLFTDLEGSTRLLQAHPAAYREAVARHHALLRAAVEAHGGAVFETVGDAVYAAFAAPAEAVAAAAAGQRALRAEDWGEVGALRARMGVHTGEVERQGGHYFGAPLYRCARLTATAHGGQTVLSEAAVALVRDALPARAGLLDLGDYRLKDLQRPERVFQLTAPGLPGDFPPLRTLDALPNNLPLQLTSFVGRERELGEVAALLGAQRLVTLTGPGGTGKTRLALQAAADALEQYPDGVWLAELAALADPALVPQAVAQAVGVREEAGRPLLATLTDTLRPKRLLLLLDNCEHLLEACARLADALLRACPGLRVVATSREALGIAGEAPHRVPSLALPDPGSLPPVEALVQYGAVKLFAERAAVTQPGFTVTGQNAAAVAQVCARLDGIPLALELAAARVRVLPVEQLLARLEDRFRLLTGGSRTALARHQTLQAAVDWSHDLLADQERALFARLSVFAEGWTLEAAEAVGADPAGAGIAAAEVLDLLTRLVDQSLVVAEAQPDGTARYRLLETLRQYAGQQLVARGEAAAWRARHAAHYLGFAERAGPELRGPRPGAWLDRVAAEHDNLRAALAWGLEAPDAPPAAALRLAGALWWFWWLRGHQREGLDRLEAALARAAAAGGAPDGALRAEALRGAGALMTEEGDTARARALLDESVALARARGDRRALVEALIWAGYPRRLAGEYPQVRRLFAEVLALARGLGDPWLTGWGLASLAWHAGVHHDDATAEAAAARSLPLLRGAGDQLRTTWAYRALGDVALRRGDPARAAAAYAEELALYRSSGLGPGVNALHGLGEAARRQGRYDQARAHLEEALALALAQGAGRAAHLCWSLGTVALDEGDPARAAGRYAEGLRLGGPAAARRGGLGLRSGVVLCLAGLARARAALGHAREAARLAGAADALAPAVGARLAPDDRAAYERDLAAARAALGEASFAAARAAGQAMSLEQAVAYALAEDRGGG